MWLFCDPLDLVGGAPGAATISMSTSKVPTICLRCAWCSPGWLSFINASSSAWPGPASFFSACFFSDACSAGLSSLASDLTGSARQSARHRVTVTTGTRRRDFDEDMAAPLVLIQPNGGGSDD